MKMKVLNIFITLGFLSILARSSNAPGVEGENDFDGSNSSIPAASDLKYFAYLFKAQKEAKCLVDYGKRINGGEFTCHENTTTFETCNHCVTILDNFGEKSCQQICNSNINCQNKCFEFEEQLNNLSGEEYDELILTLSQDSNSSSISLRPPELYCEDTSLPTSKPENAFHIVVLKWDISYTNQSYKNIPIIYVLELMELLNNSTPGVWKTAGKINGTMYPIHVPYQSKTYKWRVTAVGHIGPIQRITSDYIITSNGYVEPNPPKRIYLADQTIKDNSLDVLIAWEPADDKPCYYKLRQTPQDGYGDTKYLRFNAMDLQDGYSVRFENLQFDRSYDIAITTRRGTKNGKESNLTSTIFKMISCLDAHNHSFAKCEPTPPRNIRQENVNLVKLSNGEETGYVTIQWLPPLYSSPENAIKSFSLFIGKPVNSTGGNSTSSISHHGQIPLVTTITSKIEILGNSTQYTIKNLNLSSTYPIVLQSKTIKGKSIPVYFSVSTHFTREVESTSFPIWLITLVVLCGILILLAILHFVRHYVIKRREKRARNKYFRTIEERDGSFDDFSMVPLNEDSGTMKLFTDLPKEQWEIPYENLFIEEIIGQGAFGIVRKAKLSNKKGNTNVHNKRNKKHHGSNDWHRISKLDSNDKQNVAVKMLKVSATREDRHELIKEIITMHSLSGHSQIVNLLGACTRGRSLCLVMEYCPGGDLLSFLRKVRAKYWPTLGLENPGFRKSTGSTTILFRDGKQTKDSESFETQVGDNTTIKYADIEGFVDDTIPDENLQPIQSTSSLNRMEQQASHSLSPDPSISAQSKTKLILEGSKHDNILEQFENDDCRPIDEKDILSYARQVSMGMEFLEKNKIVHRDLAARNVLLLGDYKQVKISDFGLSRDIYTWNVYHQKTNGKLPVKWMSIESIFSHVYTAKSDVWSYGILLWELVTLGASPYPGVATNELFNLLKSGFRMERPDNCSEEFYALMKKCWRTAPGSRPSFSEIRRFVESMLESVEPSMYLSLTADLPSDYFQLSSKSDLLVGASFIDSPSFDIFPSGQTSSTARSSNASRNTSGSSFKGSSRKKKQSSFIPSTQKSLNDGETSQHDPFDRASNIHNNPLEGSNCHDRRPSTPSSGSKLTNNSITILPNQVKSRKSSKRSHSSRCRKQAHSSSQSLTGPSESLLSHNNCTCGAKRSSGDSGFTKSELEIFHTNNSTDDEHSSGSYISEEDSTFYTLNPKTNPIVTEKEACPSSSLSRNSCKKPNLIVENRTYGILNC